MHDANGDKPRKPLPPVDIDSSFNPLGRPQVPLWKQRWFQITLATLAVLAVASYVVPAIFGLLYAVRGVLTPVLIGIALAYIFNPLVTWARVRLKVPRPVSAVLLLVGFFGVLLASIPVLLIPVIRQVLELVQNIPSNLQRLSDRDDLPEGVKPLVETINTAIEQARAAFNSTVFGEDAPAPGGDVDVIIAEEINAGRASRGESPLPTVDAAAPGGEPGLPVLEPGSALAEAVPGAEVGAPQVLEMSEADRLMLEEQRADLIEEILEAADEVSVAISTEADRRGIELPDDGGLGDWIAQRLGSVDWGEVARNAVAVLNASADAIGIAFGIATYLTLAAVIVTFVFFFTVWKFDAFVQWFAPYVPASRRDRVHGLLCKMDRSVSAFIRGRLIQAVVLAFVLTLGLAFTDAAKYALLLGVVGGVLGLIPYAGLIVLPASIVLAILAEVDAGKEFSLLWAVIAPAVVFFIAQTIDSYIVEPVVQGKATNLDAITVFLVVCIGGSLAGLLGLLIAIPAAACLKILFSDVILPRLRRIAEAS